MYGFLEGILYGLLLCVLVGPIFFKILQTSIEGGSISGIALAAGQWLGDFMYIAAVFLGATFISTALADEATKQNFVFYLGSIGGSMLMLMGASMLRAAPPALAVEENTKPRKRGLALLFGQGFLINTINPFPLFFWVSLMGSTIGAGYDGSNQIGVFVGTMSTVIATDLIKIYLAKQLRLLLKPQYIIYVRRVAAVALMAFGLLLLLRA
jgi:threonine/homoserine/homoserine lactone efflux protein